MTMFPSSDDWLTYSLLCLYASWQNKSQNMDTTEWDAIVFPVWVASYFPMYKLSSSGIMVHCMYMDIF